MLMKPTRDKTKLKIIGKALPTTISMLVILHVLISGAVSGNPQICVDTLHTWEMMLAIYARLFGFLIFLYKFELHAKNLAQLIVARKPRTRSYRFYSRLFGLLVFILILNIALSITFQISNSESCTAFFLSICFIAIGILIVVESVLGPVGRVYLTTIAQVEDNKTRVLSKLHREYARLRVVQLGTRILSTTSVAFTVWFMFDGIMYIQYFLPVSLSLWGCLEIMTLSVSGKKRRRKRVVISASGASNHNTSTWSWAKSSAVVKPSQAQHTEPAHIKKGMPLNTSFPPHPKFQNGVKMSWKRSSTTPIAVEELNENEALLTGKSDTKPLLRKSLITAFDQQHEPNPTTAANALPTPTGNFAHCITANSKPADATEKVS